MSEIASRIFVCRFANLHFRGSLLGDKSSISPPDQNETFAVKHLPKLETRLHFDAKILKRIIKKPSKWRHFCKHNFYNEK